ncbi:MAG TPA: FtsW/RodA/SpoVE family cell cycle protein [Ilumatobacteraceae bacterium]|jgi:rod shape determining protein RodA
MALSMLSRKPDSGLGNIKASPGSPSRNIDWILLIVQSALTIIGLFTIYSASQTKFSNPYLYVTRQEVFLFGAVITMVIVMAFDYDWWRERARFLYGVTVMLLVLVILAGAISGGARLSFDFGPLKVQPAEFAKFTALLALAAFLAEDRTDTLVYARFVKGLILVGVPTALIIAQPDLGTASVLIAMMMGVLLTAGAKAKYILLITVLSAATVGAAVVSGVVNDYQIDRIRVFFDQNSSDPHLKDLIFQGRNSLRAIATGGIDGQGWLKGQITNSKDIPVQWADFPFSAIGEQFGLIGCSIVVGLFAILLLRIWRIAGLSRDMLGTYICAGVFTMVLWQMFQNIAMGIGLMPITGLPLPFISYGGSSIVTFFALMGLVQSVHMRRYR